jgi:predicted membrane chloride channel (bestrophin family)
MKKTLDSVLLMITCTIVHLYFTHLGQELNRKRFIVSGIVLTILGSLYSTIQTILIIKAGKKTN